MPDNALMRYMNQKQYFAVKLIKISGSKISPPAKNYLPIIIQRVWVYFHTFLKNIYNKWKLNIIFIIF